MLAGAGTGKTRVITYRIAHLIQQGVPGGSILAVTFTNKAAEQMRSRVQDLLDRTGGSAGDPWIGTFHAFCARLLRREAPRLGLSRDFAIYDDDDQRAAIKLALGTLAAADSEDDADDKPRELLSRISYWKNHAVSIEEAMAAADNPRARVAARTYEAYERVLHKSGALDFDDLLLRAGEVLRRFDDARDHWRQRFRYLHVDEYQDTNRVQHNLLRLLAGENPNLCVVGDEDQSIYRWRGADSGIILRFAQDYPGAKIFRIEQNYRSRQAILDAAAAVVAHNQGRIGKQLQATRGQGSNLTFYEARDAHAEAEWVADRIAQLQRDDFSAHIAVIYRTNAQSRSFEESFRARGWRYRLLGGFSFYQRAEVKDVLAYVRLAMFPDDDIALLRVLNTPPRGIGKTTIEALQTVARNDGSSLWTALGRTVEAGTGRALAPLRSFRTLIEDLRAKYAELPPHQFVAAVLEITGYLDMLRQREGADEQSRIDNLRELVNAVAEGAERGETLSDFLDHASLVSGADNFDERATITLLTLHTAKGLEFDHVFLDRPGRRHVPAQPLAQRQRRTRRRAPPLLRRHDARPRNAHARHAPSIAAHSAPNACKLRCPRAFSRKFPASWWTPPPARSPMPEKSAATSPTPNTPIRAMNSSAASAATRPPRRRARRRRARQARARARARKRGDSQSAHRPAGPPSVLRPRHHHPCGRRRRRPQAHRQLRRPRHQEAGRALRQPLLGLRPLPV